MSEFRYQVRRVRYLDGRNVGWWRAYRCTAAMNRKGH